MEEAVAKAAAFMPGEYAAVRNVLEELDRRLGSGWLEKAQAEVDARAPILEEDGKGQDIGFEPATTDQEDVESEAKGEGSSSYPAAKKGDISIAEVSGGIAPGLWSVSSTIQTSVRSRCPGLYLIQDELLPRSSTIRPLAVHRII
jgi:hypothetical protein